jgi:hypothetical protein
MKLSQESKGLGDTVEKITTATGIKRVFDNIAAKSGQKECSPCQKRKEALNKMFPYNNNEKK